MGYAREYAMELKMPGSCRCWQAVGSRIFQIIDKLLRQVHYSIDLVIRPQKECDHGKSHIVSSRKLDS